MHKCKCKTGPAKCGFFGFSQLQQYSRHVKHLRTVICQRLVDSVCVCVCVSWKLIWRVPWERCVCVCTPGQLFSMSHGRDVDPEDRFRILCIQNELHHAAISSSLPSTPLFYNSPFHSFWLMDLNRNAKNSFFENVMCVSMSLNI